jgi:hypothetical protein
LIAHKVFGVNGDEELIFRNGRIEQTRRREVDGVAGGEEETARSFGSSLSLSFPRSSCSTEGWTGKRRKRRSGWWRRRAPMRFRPLARGSRSCDGGDTRRERHVGRGERRVRAAV